jgi:hypothetical protein
MDDIIDSSGSGGCHGDSYDQESLSVHKGMQYP